MNHTFLFGQERKSIVERKEDEAGDSDLDFGNDEDDSDDEYEDSTFVPKWRQTKTQKATRSTSALSKYEEEEESDDDAEAKESNLSRGATSFGGPVVEADLDDYSKVTIPRRRLARWCNEPFFKEAVMKCFVKLFIGESDDGKKCYRLCEITGVGKAKSEYKFPSPSPREKPVSMTGCSSW